MLRTRSRAREPKRSKSGGKSKRVVILAVLLSFPVCYAVTVYLMGVALSYDEENIIFAARIPNDVVFVDDGEIGQRDDAHETQSDYFVPEKAHPDHRTDSIARRILEKANELISDELSARLPLDSDIIGLHGPRPVIIGLDQCNAYRRTVAAAKRKVGPSGLWNTGTNVLSKMLMENCQIRESSMNESKEGKWMNGMLYQVPWGKHWPLSSRNERRVHNANWAWVNQTEVLPVVMVKDPYTWLTSMCRHPYGVLWRWDRNQCPKLLPNERDRIRWNWTETEMAKPLAVEVHYDQSPVVHQHDSLVSLWNDWYGSWYNDADFPRLMIRFEDMLFRPEEVVSEVCHCAGGVMNMDANNKVGERFTVNAANAKPESSYRMHKGSHNLTGALIEYGSADNRLDGYQPRDVEYANKMLDDQLMRTFHYHSAGAIST